MRPVRQFEWDDAKAASNLAKHGISFSYAARVFLDVGMIDRDATKPEEGEVRRKAVGMVGGKLLTVVYTLRDNLTRIISARRSNRKEEKQYGTGEIHS